jgi:hypothetical protein
MIIYKVKNGNTEIEFLTQQEADNYIASVGIQAVSQQTDSPLVTNDIMANLEQSAGPYIDFGTDLWSLLKKKTWAFNTFLKISGTPLSTQEMRELLSSSDMIQKCLTTGSLVTARDVLMNLRSVLPRYADIANYAIKEINTFLGA